MKFTQYFLYIRQRPDRAKIKMEWIEEAIKNPDYIEVQSDEESENGKKSGRRASFSASSCFQMEKRFIMLSLIGGSKEEPNEDKVFFRYGHGLS